MRFRLSMRLRKTDTHLPGLGIILCIARGMENDNTGAHHATMSSKVAQMAGFAAYCGPHTSKVHYNMPFSERKKTKICMNGLYSVSSDSTKCSCFWMILAKDHKNIPSLSRVEALTYLWTDVHFTELLQCRTRWNLPATDRWNMALLTDELSWWQA